MSILRRYVERKLSRNFHVILTYFFDVISISEKLTSFRLTFIDVISMGQKSSLFLRTLFNIISMGKKSTWFRRTYFDVISMDEKLASFRRNLFKNSKIPKIRYHFDVHFWCSFDGLRIDATVTCLLWCVFERQKLVLVLTSIFDKFSI